MTFSTSAKIQDGGQNSGNTIFFTGTISKVSSTQRVQTLLEITLSLRVFEINDIFNFCQNSKMQFHQSSGNLTFFRGTTCNFSSTHRVQNLHVAGKRFLGKVSNRSICIFFSFKHRNSRSRTNPEINAFLYFTQIQDGRQKWRKSDFCEMSPVHSADTLWVKNFVEIALSHTVSNINALLRFMQLFKMAAKNGGKVV